jgi:hypothetical protein
VELGPAGPRALLPRQVTPVAGVILPMIYTSTLPQQSFARDSIRDYSIQPPIEELLLSDPYGDSKLLHDHDEFAVRIGRGGLVSAIWLTMNTELADLSPHPPFQTAMEIGRGHTPPQSGRRSSARWSPPLMSRTCSQIVVEVDGSMVDDGTDLEDIFERMRLLVVGEDDVEAEAAIAQEKSHEELARMLQVQSHI